MVCSSFFAMTPSASYFVIDNLSVGVDLTFFSASSKLDRKSDKGTKGSVLAVMPNASYYFNASTSFKPYLRIGAGYGRISLGSDDVTRSYNGFAAAATVGGAYFITDNVALDFGINYTYASLKIEEAKIKVNNVGAIVGFSIFF